MKFSDYTPGVGSYKVEEAGSIKGIGSTGNIDHQMGALTIGRKDISITARGLNISLSSKFNSDHLYASIINKIASGQEPTDTLMTLPEGQTNFYRIAHGWSWDLPYIIVGQPNYFKVVVNGKTFDLQSAISTEAWDAGESWVESYHVKYGTESSGQKDLLVAIPEAKVMISCRVEQTGSSTNHSYEVFNTSTYPFKLYTAGGTVMTFTDETTGSNTGFIKTITDPSGLNTATFSYINSQSAHAGQVAVQGSSDKRSNFTIEANEEVKRGDLITIRDESRVVWRVKNGDEITVSGGFNFEPATTDYYYIGSNPISTIHHTDGRYVKFYYYTYDGYERIAVVLSSDSSKSTLKQGDIFLGRYTIDSELDRLMKFETVDTVAQVGDVTSFDTGEANGLGSSGIDDSDYFTVLQEVAYGYMITNDPDPDTDYMTVKNHAGAVTKYYFQKGGFRSHSYNNKSIYTGRCRAGSNKRVINIEEPNFLIKSGQYLGVNRIKVREEAEEPDAKKISYALTDRVREAKLNRVTSSNYYAATAFIEIDTLKSSGRVRLDSALPAAPLEGDIYTVLESPDILRYVARDTKVTNQSWIYMVTTDIEEDDFIVIRNEVRKIVDIGTDADESNAPYVEVDKPFSFLPSFTNGKDHCAIFESDPEFKVYYLNKPKVVKIEQKLTAGDGQWKSINYLYTYKKDGNERTDDISEAGFTSADKDGPAETELVPDDIKLTKTSVVTWKEGAGASEDYTKEVVAFDYDYDFQIAGQKSVRNFKKDGDTWTPVDMTVNINGRPCSNASYFGVTSEYFYRNTSTYTETGGIPNDERWIHHTDRDYDGYGRLILSRKYAPSLGGGNAITKWIQYVGIGTDEGLDPLEEFSANTYSVDYQSRFDSKHCFEVVGGEITQINKDGLKNKVFYKFDGSLNITEMTNLEKSGLSSKDFLYTDLPISATVDTDTGPVTETDPDKIYWNLEEAGGSSNLSNDWEDVYFSIAYDDYGSRQVVSSFTYDGSTNVLTKITKPEGNEIDLTYGTTGWKTSYILKDKQELDDNLEGGETQYIINEYDYDLKGRLVEKQTYMVEDDGTTLYTGSGKYPKSTTEYSYDGMDRVTEKKAGETSTTAVLKQVFDDDNLMVTSTDYLGFRTKTYFDELFRIYEVKGYKPDRDTDIDLTSANEVQINWSKSVYEPVLGKVLEETKYSDNDGADGHRIITRSEYDKLGRLTRTLTKNTDSGYDGESTFKLLKESEYEDEANAVTTKAYLNEAASGADYVKTRIENDWLGRGVLKSFAWTGKNGTGEAIVTESSYDFAGNLVQRKLPSGERYVYTFSSNSRPERIEYPDGTYAITNYDENGRVIRTVDRRGIVVHSQYNKADLLVKKSTEDEDDGDIEISYLHTHLGPASVVEEEDEAEVLKHEYEYNWSGGIEKDTQTADSLSRSVEYGYNAGGIRTSMTATGSGTGGSAWSKAVNIDPQYHPSTPDTDNFNRVALLESSTAKITKEFDYLGLIDTIKYGSSTAREVAYSYGQMLRIKSLVSDEGTPAMNIALTRDFAGNILTKEGESYTYDGMNRLATGESETYAFDEISNLSSRSSKTYTYQSPGEEKSQMRLTSFYDGSDTFNYTYDEAGNVTAISGRFTSLEYDNLNRLREVTHDGSGQVDKYWYNSSALRFKREEDSGAASPVTIYTMYEGSHILFQEKYTGSTLSESRFYLILDGQVLGTYLKIYGGSEYLGFFYVDNLGSRRVVINSSGSVTDKFSYSAWGEVSHDQGTNDYLASFTGKEYDDTDLIYFNARYYDPAPGRFISEDPSRKGMNWYAYVSNNPLNMVDPTGLLAYEDTGSDGDSDWEWKVEEGDTVVSVANEIGFTAKELATENKGLLAGLSLDEMMDFVSEPSKYVTNFKVPQTDRIEAFQWAMQQVGSTDYATGNRLDPFIFTKNSNKCNAFVKDAFERGAGVDFPNRASFGGALFNAPLSANQLADEKSYGRLSVTTSPLPGDTVSTGVHAGIVGLKGNYISASTITDTVVVRNIENNLGPNVTYKTFK